MRILILNGSPKKDGNTAIALHEMEKSLRKKELRPRSFRWAVNRSGAVLPVDSVLKKADVSLTIWSTRRRRNSRNVTGLLWDRRCTMPLQMRRW